MSGLGGTAAGVLLEWGPLVLAAPALAFPGPYTPLGAGLLAAAWLVRRARTGRWSLDSPVHRPARLLVLALAVSLVASPRLEYAAPRFWGLVLGLATFYACLHTARSERAAGWAAGLLVLGGLALAGVGLVGMATPPQKGLADQAVYAALPRALVAVQTSTIVTSGFHPNQVAGVLTLFAPLAAVLAVSRPGVRGRGAGGGRLLALAAAAGMLGTLVLSQSRGALVGVATALAVGAVWRGGWRGALACGAALATAVAGVLAGLGPERVWHFLASDAPTAGTVSLAGRVELWQRGLVMLLDMPFTGIGLNGFPVVLQSFYPTIQHYELDLIPHAHNLFLHTALDLGLPGLAAFLWLAGLAVRAGLRAAREAAPLPTPGGRGGEGDARPDSEAPTADRQAGPNAARGRGGEAARRLAVGLLLGLLAHAVYSLTDAVALGAKPGPALWAALGLLATLGPPPSHPERGRACSRRARLSALAHRAWRLALHSAAARALLLGVAALALAAPVGVNAARLALHHAAAAAAPRPAALSPGLQATLEAAARLAWGPYHARAWAARALAARLAGDPDGELAALEAAAPAARWDNTLALRLGEVRLARGDRAGAADAWRAAGLLEPLLERARAAAEPAAALDWLALAQRTDPLDWRPYAEAARVLERAGQPGQAARLLAEALRVRGPDPVREALAARLLDPATPLPRTAEPPASRADGELFARVAAALAARQDLAGAAFAARAAAEADPDSAAHWRRLAELWHGLGQAELAREALERAAATSR